MTDTLEMARKALPSQETLRDRMSYDPDTGLLVWRVHQGSSAIGSLVGYKASGYFWTRVDGRIISLHRIAYIWMTGSCPSEVDHRNGNGLDNRWQNLRPATRSQNMANRAPTKNASGFPGVKRVQQVFRIDSGMPKENSPRHV